MSHWLVSGLVAACLTLAGSMGASAQEALRADLEDAVALITVFAQVDPELPTEIKVAQGSGFLVDLQQGIIVTAKHIVDAKIGQYSGKRRYMVSLGGHSGEVQAQKFGECGDGSTDICVLTIQAADVRRADVGAAFQTLCVAPAVDDAVMGLGFPPGEFSVVTRVRGFITGPRSTDQKYPSDIDIVGGMSGGPVLSEGYVIALNAGGLEANPNLTFVQALAHGGSLLEDAGIVCPRVKPGPPTVLAEPEVPEGVGNMAVTEAPAAASQPVTSLEDTALGDGVRADLSASGATATPCTELEVTASFSNIVGPDTEPAVYQLVRRVTPTENCRIASYKLSMSGNAPVERLTVDQSVDGTAIALDYAVWSGTDEVKRVKFDIAMVQKDIPLVALSPASLDASNDTGVGGPIDIGDSADISVITGDQFVRPSDEVLSGDVFINAEGPDFSGPDSLDWMITLPSDMIAMDSGSPPILPVDLEECRPRFLTIDKAVPPLGGQVQSAGFAERVEPDPGCRISAITVSDEAPISHRIINEGSGAILSYEIVSSASEPGHLAANVMVQQASTAPSAVDVPLLDIEVPTAVGISLENAFDIKGF